MSVVAGGRRRPVALWYVSAVLIAVLIAGAAYAGLVIREEKIAARFRETTEKLEEQITRARAYLGRHQNDPELKKRVDLASAEVKRRIPRGPIDVTVSDYLGRQARDIGIEDFKWSFQGGIKPPSSPPTKEEDRLSFDPVRMKSSLVDVSFTARYNEALRFIRALSAEKDAAQWPIEIKSIEMRRQLTPDSSGAPPRLAVKVVARYFYQ
jgi:hypothetical protein